MDKKTRKVSDKRAIKIFIAVLAVAFLAMALYVLDLTGAFDSEPKVEIQALNRFDETLTVAADEDYWPYVFYNDAGELSGHDIELINEVANRLEMNLDIIATSWEESLELARQGKVDAVLTCEYGDSEAMGGYLIMTTPTDSEKFVVFGREKIDRLDEAIGKRIALMVNGNVVSSIKAQGMDRWCVEYESNRAAFEALADGECDYVIVRYDIGRGILRSMGDRADGIRPFVYLAASNMCTGVVSSEPELAERVDAVTMDMRNDGTIKRLNDKWLTVFLADTSVSTVMREHPLLSVLTGLVLFGAIAGVVALLVILKRERQAVGEKILRETQSAVQRERDEKEAALRERMARVMELSDELQTICEVELNTGRYEIYSYNRDYAEAIVSNMENGNDFYANAHRDSETIVWHEDRDIVLNAFGSRECVERAFGGGSDFTVEYRMLNKGEPVWYRVRVVKRAGSDDRFLVGVFNIEERIRAGKDQQKRLEDQLARIMELSENFEAIYDVDIETGSYTLYTYGNSFSDNVLVNMTQGESFYSDAVKDADLVVYPEDRELTRRSFSDREYIRSTLEEQGELTVDYRIIAAGEPVWYRAKGVKKAGDEGRFLLGVFFINESIARQKELEKSNTLVNILSDDYLSMFTVNYATDEYTVVSKGNSGSVARNHVNTADAAADMAAYVVNYVHPDDREMLSRAVAYNNIREKLAHASRYRVTFRTNFGSDRYKYVDFIAGKEGDPDSPVTTVVMGFQDVDERVRKERENQKKLEEALAMAESANNAKTSFLFNMSHDIRTPMNAIMGYTAMAKKRATEPAVREDLEKIELSGRQLLDLINQVLEMSRIESGKVILREEPVDIVKFAESLKTVVAADIETKGISYSLNTEGVVHRNVLTDPTRVSQIIVNIVGNAVKYTAEGGRIDCSIVEMPCEKEGCGLYVTTVADTGIGMSEEYIGHLFEEFTRENSSTVSKIQGTGLGMSIVKKLLTLMDSTIDVKSRPGEGTTVTIAVPMKWNDKAAEAVPEPRKTNDISLRGKCLLLVEDNEMNREIALDILTDVGFIIETAEDGDIAVDMVRKSFDAGNPGYYDAVLMDIQMPRMNGYEATKAIRALPNPYGTLMPIIALSANAFEEDRRKSIEAGMDDHVAKPIDVQGLKETLAKYL